MSGVNRVELELWRLLAKWDRWHAESHICTDTADRFVRRAAEELVSLCDRDATTAKTPQAAEGEASQPGPEGDRR